MKSFEVNTTVVIVDAQYDFLRPDGKLFIGDKDKAARIESVLHALTKPRGGIDNIIATLDWHTPNCSEFNMFPSHCIRHTIGATSVLPSAAKVNWLTKESYSIAIPTMPRYHTDRWIFCGVCTHICVEAMISRLYTDMQNAFPDTTPNIGLLLAATGDFDETKEAASISRMQELYNLKLYNTVQELQGEVK